MVYRLPDFNLMVNVWRHGGGPPAVPDVVTLGNLGVARRTLGGPGSPTTNSFDSMYRNLLLPINADVRGIFQATGRDLVEVPAGSGYFYNVQDISSSGTGFPNAHQLALLIARSPQPSPPVPPPPAGGGGIFYTSGIGVSSFTQTATSPSGGWISYALILHSPVIIPILTDPNGVTYGGTQIGTPIPLTGGTAYLWQWYGSFVGGLGTWNLAMNSGVCTAIWVMSSIYSITPDAGGTINSGPGLPITVSTAAATSLPNEYMSAVTCRRNAVGNVVWPGGWVAYPPFGVNVPFGPDTVSMDYASARSGPAGVQTVVSQTIGSVANSLATIEVFR